MSRQLLDRRLQQRELAARRAAGVQVGALRQVAVGSRDQPHVLHRSLKL